MASKVYKKYISSDFAGINGETSSVEEEGTEFNVAQNLEFSIGNSLRGRLGCQIAGAAGQFFAIFPYTYSRTQDEYLIRYQAPNAAGYPNQTGSLITNYTKADGKTINQLIGLNGQVWVLDTMTVTVTVVAGSYPFTWYSTVSSGAIHFIMKANGVSFLDVDCGTGLAAGASIYSLLGSIDATANLAISRTTRGTCPPLAIATGATVFVGAGGYGNIYQVPVNAGHTFYPGDIITQKADSGNLLGGIVVAVAAGTINYAGPQFTTANNDVLGYMSQNAAPFPITIAASAAAGNLSLSFPYWRLIPEGDRITSNYGEIFAGARSFAQTRTSASFYAPATSQNLSGNLYVAASSDPTYDADSYWNNLIKIDGLTATRAGVGQGPTLTVTAPGAGALTGVYKYKAFLRRVDAQGNIIEGPLSSVKTITYAAQYGQITIIDWLYINALGWQGRSAYKYTAEAPASDRFFYVDDNTAAPGANAFIQPGDPICLTDNTAQKAGLWHFAFGVDVLGTLHRTVCTAYDGNTAPSSIKVADSSGYTIPNNSEISTGLTAVVLRTAAGGNSYYELCEVPYTGYATVSFFDNVTDAVLTAGTQFTEPTLGKEHNPPPPCSLVCEHQGSLVVARGVYAPNTIAVSTADGIEAFPTASNSFDVPSTQSGYVTAIASDTNDRLAVFKDRAYYDVVGDIDGGAFSVNVKHEGDYGIVSQSSLRRVRGKLLGLSRLGFVEIIDGQLSVFQFSGINARLIDQSSLIMNWAVGVNDSISRQYICSIPTSLTTAPISYVIDYSRPKEAPATFSRVYATNIDAGNGMAIVGNDFYHCSINGYNSVFKKLPRFSGNSPSGNGDGDSFIDNTSAITYILETNAINFGEPGLLKVPIRLRVWSVPNDYVNEGWVTFSALIETGASPIAAYIGSGGTNNTSSTITFSTANDVYKDIKLKNQKTHFYLVRFTTNTIRTAPFITGYEIMFAEAYEKEDFIK